jgi:hypothetical protein
MTGSFVDEMLNQTARLQEAREAESQALGVLTEMLKASITEELGADVMRNLARLAGEVSDGQATVVSYFTLLSKLEQAWRTGRHHTRQQTARMGWLATRIEQARFLAEGAISKDEENTLTAAAEIIRRMRGPVDGEDASAG